MTAAFSSLRLGVASVEVAPRGNGFQIIQKLLHKQRDGRHGLRCVVGRGERQALVKYELKFRGLATFHSSRNSHEYENKYAFLMP